MFIYSVQNVLFWIRLRGAGGGGGGGGSTV